jgi:superfamily II DNA or RNA helicase
MIIRIELSNKLNLIDPPQSLVDKIQDAFTIQNPAWLDNKKMSRWNGRTKRWLQFYRRRRDGLSIPRGATGLILFFCKEMGCGYEIIDERRTLQPLDFAFTGVLKGYQQQAVSDILQRDFGVLQAGTGTGKTVVALDTIAKRRQPALVIVHSKELLNQWIERIEHFLDIPRSEIGVVGGGKAKIGEKITVGIVNSIYPIADEIREHIGYLIVDECHRTPSRTFTEAVSAFDSKYMLGLSATPYRRDGLTKLIGWYLGRETEINSGDLTEADIILDVEVVTRETAFSTAVDPSEEYVQMLSELTQDEERNSIIVNDVLTESSINNGICLVLSDRKEHCSTLADLMKRHGVDAEVLTGDVSNNERKQIVERLNTGDVRVLVATGQLIGEGFDCRGLSTLFLTVPIKFEGRLIQYLGRILRPAPGKDKARVYDYVDASVGILKMAAKARQRIYSRL